MRSRAKAEGGTGQASDPKDWDKAAAIRNASLLLRWALSVCCCGYSTAQSTARITGQVDVSGRVVNALTGAAIPRVLVNLNGRSVLSDPDGEFVFPGYQAVAGTQTNVQTTKPGYASALDAVEALSPQPVPDITAPLELRMYPDGLISGTVTGTGGQPIAKAQLSVFRKTGDEGATRLAAVGMAVTDSRGQYRLEEPPGHYSVLLRYAANAGDDVETVLPQRYPEQTSSSTSRTFLLNPGEQRTVDLHARTGIAYVVTLKTDFIARDMNFRLDVRTTEGDSFSVFPQPSKNLGEFVFDLPSGNYVLHAVNQVRESRMEAESRVTVAGHPVDEVRLHFADVPTVPIQVAADTSTAGSVNGIQPTIGLQNQLPTAQHLALRLKKLEDQEEGSSEVGVTTVNGGYAFQAQSGVYRLVGRNDGDWFVVRATYGTTDLLNHSINLVSGAGGEVIRIAVSRGTGQVAGTVRKSGQAAAGFVYLFPHEPGLSSLYTARAGEDGVYTKRLPPGTYTAVALNHRFIGDLENTELKAHFESLGTLANVTPGAQTTADLTLSSGDDEP